MCVPYLLQIQHVLAIRAELEPISMHLRMRSIKKHLAVQTIIYRILHIGWMLLNCVLEKTFESPLDSNEIKLVNLKGNQP